MLKRKNDDAEGSTTKRMAAQDENNTPRSVVVRDSDPTYVHFRMLLVFKEALMIVGPHGETINNLKERANVRINVSDNLPNIPQRTISVRGPAENVAQAFGLIVRTLMKEEFDVPSNEASTSYNLKLLVPHPMMGYVIGKQGSKFREIEEHSAARLKADELQLPFSNDRVLNVTGVADAIHIAVYYVAQTILEHKEIFTKHKCVYYNPVNYQPPAPFAQFPGMMPVPPTLGGFPYFPGQPGAAPGVYGILPGMMDMKQEQAERVITVPAHHIGCVIGKKGSNLVNLRNRSGGCYVKVHPAELETDPTKRTLTLKGTEFTINTAEKMIWGKINFEEERLKKKIEESRSPAGADDPDVQMKQEH
ncbi:hypothetical protein BABINDRAFT_163611 [Babjeviella inositovora NRRL Y-12698]|uniref:K Homology domain-containing protein n=1 Tax=Babjeviella inositovora NRRL Y-12698 TaxID=984486 RepID=A0A1E3QIS8_9ASCO|nr:uncharacterized protein BABINDRAFT_163611 [Babjeviella inositovora NRRL Y-12698]ODQ77354.1 hypothetical protein BABINDRAFT_163611 [Babjeviella inositovora NRRL Y-12698]